MYELEVRNQAAALERQLRRGSFRDSLVSLCIYICMHICRFMLFWFVDKLTMSLVLCSLCLQSFHKVLHSAVIECCQMYLH